MPAKNVLVRVLVETVVDGVKYACNEVVGFEQKLAKRLADAGHVDADPDAVAYAQAQLGAQPREHVPAAGADSTAPVPAQGGSDASQAEPQGDGGAPAPEGEQQ